MSEQDETKKVTLISVTPKLEIPDPNTTRLTASAPPAELEIRESN